VRRRLSMADAYWAPSGMMETAGAAQRQPAEVPV
jgi:hypothetical protein